MKCIFFLQLDNTFDELYDEMDSIASHYIEDLKKDAVIRINQAHTIHKNHTIINFPKDDEQFERTIRPLYPQYQPKPQVFNFAEALAQNRLQECEDVVMKAYRDYMTPQFQDEATTLNSQKKNYLDMLAEFSLAFLYEWASRSGLAAPLALPISSAIHCHLHNFIEQKCSISLDNINQQFPNQSKKNDAKRQRRK